MAELRTKHPARRFLLRCLFGLVALLLLCALSAGAILWYFNPAVERTDGIVYTSRGGKDLTLDVVRPAGRRNGCGVLLMVSGSWKSRPEHFDVWMAAPLLREGFTVFAVSHLSQPEARVQDIVGDVERAVRFVRHHAHSYGVDPDRLGITGGSSGGHLSLMIATRGGPGDLTATDPVDRESSAVQAAAIFFPVTNLYDLGRSTENTGDGGPPKSFRQAFGPEAADLDKWKAIAHAISPLDHVRPDQPPVLIIHGDADTLVPLEQSEWFADRARQVGAEVELQVRCGKSHGWLSIPRDVGVFADWFAKKLDRAELAEVSR